MKDEEVKLEEIEVSHTLGGTGRWYAVTLLSYTLKYISLHGHRQTMTSLGCDNDAPAYMR